MSSLSILHTSDLHNRLSVNAEKLIENEYKSMPNVLLLDSGDAIRSGNICFNILGERILKKLSSLNYDAMAMGNREFHFSNIGLKSKLKNAGFPILSANLKSDTIDIKSVIQPYIIKSIGNINIGVFGLTVPMITKNMFVSKLSPFYFDNPIDSAKNIIKELKPKCNIIIALTHIGIDCDKKLAQNTDDIDIILGGHSHTIQPELLKINNTYISHSGYWGEYLSRINLTFADCGIISAEKHNINLKN